MNGLLPYDPTAIEILKDKLYWISSPRPPHNTHYIFFSVDDQISYTPLNYDFGPVDLGKVYKYTRELLAMLNTPTQNNPFVHYTSLDPAKRANSAFLMCAFQIIVFGRSAASVWEPFSKLKPKLVAFRDASTSLECTYECTILDCLRGLEYAIKLKWFNLATFDLAEYHHYSQVEYGDLNWAIPDKMLAFSGPVDQHLERDDFDRMTPEKYVPIFNKLGVGTVIRLNSKLYNEDKFKKAGINHVDLIFPDGSCPNQQIIQTFLSICENEPKAIAIHCKAGLGRTGTLIACYAMKHFKFAAADFIGWIRLCRPGSILGPQQQFLVDIEPYLHSLADKSNIYNTISPRTKNSYIPRTMKDRQSLCLNQHEKMVAMYGDSNQGGYLMEAKGRARKSCSSPFTFALDFDTNNSPRNIVCEEDIPSELTKIVNRSLLSKHKSASRGTLKKNEPVSPKKKPKFWELGVILAKKSLERIHTSST